jgi:hypothetical protein
MPFDFGLSLLIGGALMAGGAAANSLSQRAKRKALLGMKAGAIDDFRELGDEYKDLFDPIMQQYSRERDANMSLYRSEMRRAEQSFSRYFDQARTEYGAGMDRALGEMRIGRESTLALARQETERQQQGARARNAFTGLGQTSFGQGQVQAIGRQGVLQEGVIQEQYASQLSALEAQRAQGMSTLSAQMGQGMSGIQQSLATNLSNMYQTYSGNIANMQQQGLGQQFNMYQQGLNIGYQFGGQAANLAGSGIAAVGSAMGSFGGALFGAGLGGMMAPASAAAGSAGGFMSGNMTASPASQMAPPGSFYGNLQASQYGYGNYYGSMR